MKLDNDDVIKTKAPNDKNTILNKNNYDQLLKDKNNKKNDKEDEDSSKSENNEDKAKYTSDDNKNDKIYSSEEGKKYVNSGPMDIIRDLYSNDSSIGLETTKLDSDFIKNLRNYEIDKKYNNAIENAKNNKKQLNPIKEYKQFSTMFGVLTQSILENTNKDGEISLGDLNDFFKEGSFKKLEDKLVNDLEKKNDKGELAYTNEQRNFIRKVLELLGTIKNNHNFSFDSASAKQNLGYVFRNVWFNYQNSSFIKKLLAAICDFLTFSNSHKNTREVMFLSEQIIKDADAFYDIPFNERQILINKMTQNLAKIKHLLHSIPFLPNKTNKSFEEAVKCIDQARNTKTSAVNVITDLIAAFGIRSIENSSINAINENTRKLMQDSLTKSIMDSYKDLTKAEASNIAGDVLMCDASGKKFYKTNNNENIFYDGKIKKEYDAMSSKLEQTNEVEDVKIKCNTNLLKVEYIKKQTEQFIDAMNIYVANTRQHIAKCMEKYTLLAGAGANCYDKNINSVIKGISDKMIENIYYSFKNLKHSFYEYEDNYVKRKNIIYNSKTSFEEEKEEINQTIKKCLCDKDGNPKNGKVSDVEEIKDMVSKMKNIPEYSFACCEEIYRIINNIIKDINAINNTQFLKTSNNNNNNLFKLANNKSVIENNMFRDLLDKNALNGFYHKKH